MKVWILRSGQDYEGEQIDGVFARREDARQPFIDAALKAAAHWRITEGRERAEAAFDGAEPDTEVEFRAGDEWVNLDSYDVIESPSMPEWEWKR